MSARSYITPPVFDHHGEAMRDRLRLTEARPAAVIKARSATPRVRYTLANPLLVPAVAVVLCAVALLGVLISLIVGRAS